MLVSGPIAELLERLQDLETEIETDLVEQRRRFRYTIEKRRVRFEAAVRAHHKTLRTSAARFIARSSIPATLFSPLVYAVIVPLVLLDFAVTVFQWICCPVYGIPKAPRADFIVVDRHHLAYLNLIEKLNCAYCGYANGVLAYAREIAGRAEAHWCPIKHARKTQGQHRRYYAFADFGDAEGWEQIKADPGRMVSPRFTARDGAGGGGPA